jgi:hypothetical protein
LGLLLLPWITAALCRRFDLLSPVLIFTMCIFVGYIIPIPAFLEGVDPVTTSWTNVYGNFERSLERALWVTILGVVGFYLGYLVMRDLALTVPVPALKHRPARWRESTASALFTTSWIPFSVGVVIIGGPSKRCPNHGAGICSRA